MTPSEKVKHRKIIDQPVFIREDRGLLEEDEPMTPIEKARHRKQMVADRRSMELRQVCMRGSLGVRGWGGWGGVEGGNLVLYFLLWGRVHVAVNEAMRQSM